MKKLLIIIPLALLACLVIVVVLVLRSRSDGPVGQSVLDTSQGPAFEVRVVMPRLGLPLGGILPDALVKKLDGTPRELGFDHTSPGAKAGNVENQRLELNADGWALFIETDSEGRISPETHLEFPLGLGGRRVRLDCRPADKANGFLHATSRAAPDVLDGRFIVELAKCRNTESGKATNWPPAPLTVNGSFAGLPQQRR